MGDVGGNTVLYLYSNKSPIIEYPGGAWLPSGMVC